METSHKDLHEIDLKAVFMSKNAKLAKKIPGFIYRLLGKLLCLDEINSFIRDYGTLHGIDSANAIIEFLKLKCIVKGEENLYPENCRCIFVSNHPLGGPDGIALIHILGKHYKYLKFPVNDILMNLTNLSDIFLPVNKHGAFGRDAAIKIDEAYKSDAQIIMFPAGLVSRKNKGIIKDLEWQKSFVTKAIEHQRSIVPIHILSKNSKLFYRIANLRKFLKIKVNIEMLLLPREAIKKRGSTLIVKIGKPIHYNELDKDSKPSDIAEKIKEQVYSL